MLTKEQQGVSQQKQGPREGLRLWQGSTFSPKALNGTKNAEANNVRKEPIQ